MNADHRPYRYYDFFMAAYVCVLLCANLIGAAKLSTVELPVVGSVTFLTGVLFFPMSYFFGDVLTEVYGYARDRRVVWAGFGALGFASLMAFTVVHMPPASEWASHQSAVEQVFGSTPRIVFASIIAFWAGSFANSFVLAKLKLVTQGRHLWMRTIGSTAVGEGVDSAVFMTIAFYGLMPNHVLIGAIETQYVLKVLWEIIATPITYPLVAFVKKREQVDFYDRHTNFTPFTLEVER
jgi:uncharacterized integral membrane protein (TIGR00697 family)